ncbi:MAG: ArsR/SmtB family transcription factor [Nocardioidaceae bacterium]
MTDSTDSALIEECRRLADIWAPVLRGLANPDRLLIVLWLADTSSTVRELETVTGLRQSLVSYHLKALRETGLVTATAVGRANRYRLANSELNKLAELLGNSGISPEQVTDLSNAR